MKAVLFIVVAAVALPSFGESTSTLSTARIDQVTSRVGAPSVSSSMSADNMFQVQAANGDSNASIKISTKRTATDDGFWVVSLVGQAPTSKGNGNGGTSLATGDGLASGTTLALKFSDSYLTGKRNNVSTMCDKYKDLYLSIDGKKGDDWVCDTGHVAQLKTDKQLVAKGRAISKQEYEDYEANYFAPAAALISFGGSAKGGYQDFSFYDATTLASQKKREGLWSAGAFISYLPIAMSAVLTGTISVQSSYKDAKSSSQCLATPSANSSFLTCANGSIGSPAHKTTEILALEWRQQVTEHAAIALQVSRDFRNKITAVQLPVYFIHDAKGGLTGGFTFGWTSQDHKGSMGVFVNQAFSLFD